ncbi:lytic transglycosylase domain-containing protein (plasmid) [Vibrio cholerae]|uniref:lytic transglycosylase domain-containing protein n=1 Tax=Vibrio cholerae TaxID=666 RepID=UPI001183FEBA|nr:lytic transglycosylase domain-containing protein [Vibrio cholerae]EJL6460821.1 lytic transglycosylase domain-containing protein [Vibrio cholerae]MBJ6954157.1 lytic transglycosylase domain-containing protein [Vibrio cholerae]MVC22232.1 lytic transglycosylase [Vibrio cholerae]QKU73165.1 lytic transglycosylase domain-containing protein [Vibrio cholerae]QKU77155.1 lytic transglycosylase domain-containing protein [Vibrio cholerae]
MVIDISIDDVARGTTVAPMVIEQCVEKAADKLDFDSTLMMAILDVERGKKGTVSYNESNGSFDLGPGQVNTIQFEEYWFKHEYPTVTWQRLKDDVCLNLEVAGRVLKQRLNELKDGQSVWNAVGHYHSKTKTYKLIYLQKVMKAYRIRAEKEGAGFNIVRQ